MRGFASQSGTFGKKEGGSWLSLKCRGLGGSLNQKAKVDLEKIFRFGIWADEI